MDLFPQEFTERFRLGAGPLSPAQLEQTADLYYAAFEAKIRHLDVFARARPQAVRLLRASLRPANALFAFAGEHLAAFIGLEFAGGQRFVDFTPAALRQEFGHFGGLWRHAWLSLSHAYIRPRPGELRIDSLAVAPEWRGHGLGTQLIALACQRALQTGCHAVTLEVVDSNPRARQLYERLGFQTARREWYGPVTSRAGLSGVDYMRKNLAAPP